jgi:hypothetical protein
MTTPNLSVPSELDAFVRAAKAAAVPDESLVAMLRHRGWSERRVYASLAGYYGDLLGVAPPGRSTSDERSRDAFFYLLNFITLAFWTVALGQLFYVLIARWIPDAATAGYGRGPLMYEVAWQLATVIVAFPAFVVVGRLIARELQRRPDAFYSGVRSWLTYIALVITALIVLMDGIWFLEAFLRGELSVRFVLDSLVLLVLGGGVFSYYLSGMRPPDAVAAR